MFLFNSLQVPYIPLCLFSSIPTFFSPNSAGKPPPFYIGQSNKLPTQMITHPIHRSTCRKLQTHTHVNCEFPYCCFNAYRIIHAMDISFDKAPKIQDAEVFVIGVWFRRYGTSTNVPTMSPMSTLSPAEAAFLLIYPKPK